MSDKWITRVDDVTEPEWNALLDGFSDANLYQTWAYGAESWGERQLSHIILERAGRPVAVAQLRLVQVPLLGSGVAYLRWGPVCVPQGESWNADIFHAITRAILVEYAQRRRLLVRIIPHLFHQEEKAQAVLNNWSDLGLQLDAEISPYRTFRVNLTPAPEVLRKKLDQKWRNQLNGAERNGLTVEEGTSDGLYGKFLSLYHDMMARKKFETTVDVDEFRRIQQRLPSSQKMMILISCLDGKPMTGLVGSIVGDTGVYLLGATSDEGMKTKGSYLLQWRMMQRLKERGCVWYDLGGINPEKNPGVYHFKQGMGGEDNLQVGRFSAKGGSLSTLSVTGGERLKELVGRLKNKVATRPSSGAAA